MQNSFFYLFLFFLTHSVNILYAQEKFDIYRWNEIKNEYDFDFKTNNKNKALDSLNQIGFYTLQIDSIKTNKIYLNKGKNYKTIWVKNESIFKNSDYNPTNNLDSILSKIIDENSQKGYTFSNFKIIPKGTIDNEQKIELILNLGELRRIDAVKSINYPKLSKGYIKYGLGLKNGKIYNDEIIQNASKFLSSTNYIQQLQEPQTLFKPDSTIVYIYPSKIKSNQFDGIIGFGNDDQGKFKLNGNVLLELNNVFNGLEQIRLNWIGTANKNTTLDLRVKLPYLFKSPIGSETELKLFKQDSVFVNINLGERLFYQLNPNASIGVNLNYTSSNYLLNDIITTAYDDYNKTGLGISYNYFLTHPFTLMEGKSYLNIKVSSLKRKEKNFSWTEDLINKTTQQYEIRLFTYRIFQLAQKHYLKTKIDFSALMDKRQTFTENELYRIGGFNSIRGFNEESIIANMYGIGSLEYRFLPNEAFYVNLFTDYAYINNKRNNLNSNLLSFGAGISFLTKLGIFNLSYAVGKNDNQPFDFNNSKIHFGILSRF